MAAVDVPAQTGRTRWAAVVAVAVGTVLFALDMSVVAVALPVMGAAFDVGPDVTQWIVLAYMLPLLLGSLPAGSWLDRAGPRPAFVLAVGGFGVASALIAVAPALWLVLLGRVLQGVFGAVVGVIAFSVVAAAVRPEHRARAMSVVLTLIPLAGVAGPAVGGWLTELAGWRSVFLINVPIVLIAAWVGARAIPVAAEGAAGLPRPSLRMAADSLRALELLRHRELALPMLALPMITVGVGGINFLVPYLMSDAVGAEPGVVGATLLAFAVGMAALGPPAGWLADRFGHRPVTLLGAVVTLAGLVTLLLLPPDVDALDVAWRLALVGVGHGLFAGPNSAAVLQATPAGSAGAVGGVSALLRTLGFTVGPAAGAYAWGAGGSGMDGFTLGIVVLAGAAAVAVVATAAQRHVRR